MTVKPRYVPLVNHLRLRTAIGVSLLLMSVLLAIFYHGCGHFGWVAGIFILAWAPSVWITDKYVHKYPQRYMTYLLASHLKAAIIMALLAGGMGWLAGPETVPQRVVWGGFSLFIILDAMVSVPSRREIPNIKTPATVPAMSRNDTALQTFSDEECRKMASSLIDKEAMLRKIHSDLDESFLDFIRNQLPDFQVGTGEVLILDDIPTTDNKSTLASVGLLIGRTRINDVLRLNQFMQFCIQHTSMGGYFVIRYLPLENLSNSLRQRYNGILYWLVYISHFIWYRAIPKIPFLEKLYFTPILSWLDKIHLTIVKRRNRALAKAEVWGRLSFFGMNVIAESKGSEELFIIAQRVSQPVQNKIPSFYMIAALEKVGLDGKIMHMHKIRTMYPFSEFLQKRIFEDHGLASTGKIANDFRLTDYGRFLRKYWLDELPQIFDWLRGDVKLVGMRATSPHFLSLYPRKLYDLYIQIKPGLIPPIFDENTTGFEQIVNIEFKYLENYKDHPIQTDIKYFYKTLSDIFFRGVRSK